ncbi:uncharacterized protein LOC143040710 [Oratosquilla oratoria]|uniref:uncharacterized protein LOC143040710 n=1 Tax=Oratosquilla oratoria TaxID=337810 RepID=UPI003F76D811
MAILLALVLLQTLTKALGMDQDTAPLPSITSEVKKARPSILDLWEFVERNQGPRKSSKAPRTILAPDEGAMVNLVPQDTPDPLYGSSPSDVALRKVFLLDHMFDQLVDPNDSWTVKEVVNFAGTLVTFERDSEGELFVAGVHVRSAKVLPDGTALYTLEDIPFRYRQKVQEAWEKLMAAGGGEEGNPFMEGGPPELD